MKGLQGYEIMQDNSRRPGWRRRLSDAFFSNHSLQIGLLSIKRRVAPSSFAELGSGKSTQQAKTRRAPEQIVSCQKMFATRNKKRLMEAHRIEKLLIEALLQEGPMAYALYEYDLENHIDDWYESMLQDENDFLFAVNENSGDVAMVLITPEKTLYINEQARSKLKEIWEKAYASNLEHLIPIMARELANDSIAVSGVSSIGH